MKVSADAKEYVLVSFLLFAALLFRLHGIDFGLPFLYHADEPIVVNHALSYGSGSLHPHFFNIPPLVSYILFGLYGLFYVLCYVTGIFSGVSDFEKLFFTNPSAFYLSARLLFGAIMGAATVLMVYLSTRQWGKIFPAMMAAVLLAFSYLHIHHSHYIYVDIPLTFMFSVLILMLVWVDEKFSTKRHLLFGVLLGVAVGTKYNAFLMAVPFAWILMRQKPGVILLLRALCLTGLVSVLSFFVVNPYAILDFPFFISELQEQSAANQGVAFLHHLNYSLREGSGIAGLVVGISAMVWGAFTKDRRIEALCLFCVLYYLLIALKGQVYARYALGLLPAACVLMGLFLERFVRCRLPKPLGIALGVLLVFLVTFPQMSKAMKFNKIMNRQDVRTLTQFWVQHHFPADTKIALDWEFYMPRLAFSSKQLKEKVNLLSAEGQDGGKKRRIEHLLKYPVTKGYELYFMREDPDSERFLMGTPTVAYDLKALKAKDVEYVLFLPQYASSRGLFYKALKKDAKLVKRISPYRKQNYVPDMPVTMTGGPFSSDQLKGRDRNGLIIEVYRLSE